MDEITRLAEFRADTEPMTAHARLRGRLQLADAIAGTPPARGGRRPTTRRVLVAAALTAALTAGVVGTQIAGPGATESSARAISALNLAADALADAPQPRPDQFVYMDVLHTSSGEKSGAVQWWFSVGGSEQGLVRTTSENSLTLPPRETGPGLRLAPYSVLAALPTDPDELLRRLEADPAVHESQIQQQVSREVAIWDLIRTIMDNGCPAPQQAALFRAAAKLPIISYSEEVTDALGRSGEAVGALVPRVGTVQLILDRNTHAFLGERVVGEAGSESEGRVKSNSAVRTFAIVDRADQLPS
ncbi:CU044_5270 family protein [Kitasatospora sp. NPDC059795]|uniref:CU044_5270 family protein n=1 Tax=Kitasatospora sp. NPDC059795 TaxID=3346949 RepID=UPI00364FB910